MCRTVDGLRVVRLSAATVIDQDLVRWLNRASLRFEKDLTYRYLSKFIEKFSLFWDRRESLVIKD